MSCHLILSNNAFLGMDQYNVTYNHFTPLVQDVRSLLGWDQKMLRGTEKMLQTQGTASENEVSLPIA